MQLSETWILFRECTPGRSNPTAPAAILEPSEAISNDKTKHRRRLCVNRRLKFGEHAAPTLNAPENIQGRIIVQLVKIDRAAGACGLLETSVREVESRSAANIQGPLAGFCRER